MKNIIRLAGPLVAIVLLFILVGNFGAGKVSEIRASVAKEKKNVTILSQKLSLLNEVTESVSSASLASTALPEKNPALAAISQLKSLAVTQNTLISKIKSGSAGKDKSGISKVDITFDLEGQRSQVFQFLTAIENIAPISRVEKVKLNEIAGATRATITIKSYFAELPTKLPALTDAVNDLTADEKKTLSEVTGLTQPNFVSLPASQGGGKPDPFGI